MRIVKEWGSAGQIPALQNSGAESNEPPTAAAAPLKIGKYCISQSLIQEDHVSIYCDDGEGGGFKKNDLFLVIDKFYTDNF
jgi:hypothetical protein